MMLFKKMLVVLKAQKSQGQQNDQVLKSNNSILKAIFYGLIWSVNSDSFNLYIASMQKE